jgi:hypothetical protein
MLLGNQNYLKIYKRLIVYCRTVNISICVEIHTRTPSNMYNILPDLYFLQPEIFE